MRILVQRSPEPVPYDGAYARLAATSEEPTRVRLVLAPEATSDASTLSLLLGLTVTLGEAEPGSVPLRQHWLTAGGELQGKMDLPLASRHDEEARRLAARMEREWERFLDNVLRRLQGEPRGDAHLAYPGGAYDPAQPSVGILRWPPLVGEALPTLE